MTKRIGLISTFAPGKQWDPSVSVRVSAEHEDLKRRLIQAGYEVSDAGSLHRSYDELIDAAHQLRSRNIMALVIFVGTWALASGIAAA
ncbi:MAG: hypothetical protein RSD95_14675, partial [Clostridia bacterium]